MINGEFFNSNDANMEFKSKNLKEQGSKKTENITNKEFAKLLEIRKNIIDSLGKELESNPSVEAVFIVGSEAQNKIDQYSDIDFDIVLDPDSIKEIEKIVKESLEKFSPIKTELKRTTTKGNSQVIYQFEKIPKFLHVDVMYLRSIDDFDIHGSKIKVLFDKNNIIQAKELSEDEIIEKIRGRIEKIEKYNELRQTYVEKELNRGHYLGAFEKYRALVLEILIEALRFKYCPGKSDYYVMHIEKDLPEDVVREVEDLFKVSSIEEIKEKNIKANELLNQTLEELKLKIQTNDK